jgi:hypothetical protein
VPADPLAHGGWGEPPCGHTAPVPRCLVCLTWQHYPNYLRTGIAADCHTRHPGVYAAAGPAAVEAAKGRLKTRFGHGRRADAAGRVSLDRPANAGGRFRATLRAEPASWSVTVSAGGTPTPPTPTATGPGRELTKMYHSIGVPPCSACEALATKMDAWGPAGCRERAAEIVADINGRVKLMGLIEKARVGGKLLAAGLPLTVEGQVELAIARAEAK